MADGVMKIARKLSVPLDEEARANYAAMQPPAAPAQPDSGLDRDEFLPLARRIMGGKVEHGTGLGGSDWHLAAPRFVSDAVNTAVRVGSAPLRRPQRLGPETREDMVNAAGAVVGPMASVGMTRAAMPTPHERMTRSLQREGFNTQEPVYNGWWGKAGDKVGIDDTHSQKAYWFTPSADEARIYQDVARLQPDVDPSGVSLLHKAYVNTEKILDASTLSHPPKHLNENGNLVFDHGYFNAILDKAKMDGHDGVRFKNVIDMSPVPHDQIALFGEHSWRPADVEVNGSWQSPATTELGIFGGRMARTADHAALAKAEQMTTARRNGAPTLRQNSVAPARPGSITTSQRHSKS